MMGNDLFHGTLYGGWMDDNAKNIGGGGLDMLICQDLLFTLNLALYIFGLCANLGLFVISHDQLSRKMHDV